MRTRRPTSGNPGNGESDSRQAPPTNARNAEGARILLDPVQTEGRSTPSKSHRPVARQGRGDAVPPSGAVALRGSEGAAARITRLGNSADRVVFRPAAQVAAPAHTMSLPPPRPHWICITRRDVSRVVPTGQIPDTQRCRRGAKWPRRGNPHFPFINYPLSITVTSKTLRLVRNPATRSLRTGRLRNLPAARGLATLTRSGGDSGKSLSTEVGHSQAIWTHTWLRSSCRTSCRAAGERFVRAAPPAERRDNLPTPRVRGARTGRFGPVPAPRRRAGPEPAAGEFFLALPDRLPARIQSAILDSHLHRERPLR